VFSGFMVDTWVVASVVAVVAGVVGFFVVLRGATFAAHALPLGAFPGAAAASLLGVSSLWGLVVFSGLGVVGIAGLARRTRRDVAIALSLVTLLGLGALLLSMTSEYAPAIEALLFGQVLGVGAGELLPVTALAAVGVVGTGLAFRPLLLSSVSADLAEARGVGRERTEWWFLGLVALVTALALPVVGALLVFSLMVGPPAAARCCTDHPVRALGLSVVVAVGVVWGAIALAYETNWPVGFFVGVGGALVYGLGRTWQGWRRRTVARPAVPGAAG
jgi:zinc/manganese transport system permease protein